MQSKHFNGTIVYLLALVLLLNFLLYWQYSTHFSSSPPTTTLIRSGIAINSFNPTYIHFTLHPHLTPFQLLSIIDNNVLLLQISHPPPSSPMTMILSDGFHRLQILLLLDDDPPSTSSSVYEEIDLSAGRRSLLVTVLDGDHRPVENVSVHLELVDYSHIGRELRSNKAGEVLFDHLPEGTQVYVEAACLKSKRQAFVEVNTNHYRNISLVLEETSAWHYDEYDPADRGYYAV